MSKKSVYLDHAATTPVDSRVAGVMLSCLTDTYGNPSSVHRWGRAAKTAVETSRETIAQCLGALPEEVFFTSGGTESNNLAIFGVAHALKDRGRHIVTSAIEHPAILEPCRTLEKQGWEITYLPVDKEGFVSINAVRKALREDTVLVSIMHGNNEVGTLQPIAEIGRLLRRNEIAFHTDAVQTMGKVPIDLNALAVDYLSFSGHKLYGPKGIGGLYIRQGAIIPEPLQYGGGQQSGLRPGTENVPGIVGLAKALEISVQSMTLETARLRNLQTTLIAGIEAALPGTAILNGPRNLEERVPGNVNFSFPGIEGEALILHLDLKGIAASSGSACHSNAQNEAAIEPSHVVLALGKPEAAARGTLRLSLGRPTSEADIERVLEVLPEVVGRLSPASSEGAPV